MWRLALDEEQRRVLAELRDHAGKPYVRERAAALLKVAAGQSAAAVAGAGLLRPRRADTVAAWLGRFRAQGVAGLAIRPGRGRKPAFSPPQPRRRDRARGVGPRGAPRPAPVRHAGDALDA